MRPRLPDKRRLGGLMILLACLGITVALAGCTATTAPTFTPTSPPTATRATPTPVVLPSTTPTATPTTRPTATEVSPTSTSTAPPQPILTAAALPPSATPTASPLPSATSTTASVPDIEIIVDNRDPGFTSTGAWFVGDGGQSYQGDCAWAPLGIQNIAYVRPSLPQAGAYEIFAWWCGDPNHDQSRRAQIQVYPTLGRVATWPVHVNLQENAGQWNSLGTYYLETNGMLTVDGGLDGNVVADAFRFVYRSPERVIVTPTPLPTPIVWTTHPPTPLEQLTSGDLSARLGLVQYLYPYTPLIASQAVTFDDCQAFPRQGCGGSREGWRAQVQYQDMIVTYRVSQDYRLVAIEPPEALAERQLLYLRVTQDSQFFRVDRYPDDTWNLSGADLTQGWATHWPLDAARIEALRPLLHTYGSLTWQTPDGMRVQLYGLGERVALSEEDGQQLATLAVELADIAWNRPPR